MIPNYLYGFRCKCGCGTDRMDISYFGKVYAQKLVCRNCETIYIRKTEKGITKYEIEKGW